MSTLATLLERPDLQDKHRVKLQRMQGMTLSPAMQFSITRIAQKYNTVAPVKIEGDRSEKNNRIKCFDFFKVSFYDLLEIVNNEEQEIIRTIFQKDKEERQERANRISLNNMNSYRIINSQDREEILSIVSKYYYEEEKEGKPPTVEDWQEFVAEIIKMQLTYFNEISKPEQPDRLNKFEHVGI